MVAIIAIVLALASLCISVLAIQRLNVVVSRLALAEKALASPAITELDELPRSRTPKPLEGLRIGIDVRQDHAHPVFAGLLKELLLKEDVSDVATLSTGAADVDIRIVGSLTCNGYAEVYYQAEFTCYTATEAVCTIVERPPGGDRPENLAMELVTKLSSKLDELVKRNERRRAIGELHGP